MLLSESVGQVDSARVFKKSNAVWVSTGVGFSAGFYLLYQTWYKPYSRQDFMFFDDSREWLGMDKVGHFGTAWFIHGNLAALAHSNGFTKKEANRYALVGSATFMTAIEIMDGFSTDWGFSWFDYAANVSGIAYSAIQYRLTDSKLPVLKYSWQPGDLHSLRPDLLGNSIPTRMLKNYNEQTYWLSFPMALLSSNLPNWFCFSIGYSANGMVGGQNNLWSDKMGLIQDYTTLPRRSEIKLSFDIDLTQLKFKKNWQKKLVTWLRWLKIPAPALVLQTGKRPGWYPVYW